MVLGSEARLEARRGSRDKDMNNFENGENLLNEADKHFEGFQNAVEKKWWNIAIREAQEAVELSLKGLLKMMNIEYPKIHDVAPLLSKIITEKGLKIDEKALNKIVEISGDLAIERAPAFYVEKIYTEERAREAQDQASYVLVFAKDLAKKLKGSKI